MILFIILALLAFVGAAAAAWGIDSRETFADPREPVQTR